MTCKEIISRRRELFESKGYDMPIDSSDVFIKEVIDVLSGAGIKDIEKRNENLEGYFINTMGGCVWDD